MNGVRVAVHQSSNFNERRKLLSITASPSVAAVSEIAPRWITASSLRPSSQRMSSGGAIMSASWRFCRLRHFPSCPSQSLTATSWRPASLRLATTFEPMNPAPPVTNNIVQLEARLDPTLCLSRPSGATERRYVARPITRASG